MLQEVADDKERIDSRLQALISAVDVHVNEESAGSVAILLRDRESGDHLAEKIAQAWGVEVADLSAFGPTIATPRSVAARDAEAVIINGYYGTATIDDLRRSGARAASMVLDPLESQALHRGLDAMCLAVAGSDPVLYLRCQEAICQLPAGSCPTARI